MRRRRAAAGELALAALRLFATLMRRARQTLYVTLRGAKPYALTVGGLACFVVSAFTVSPTLGWLAAGVAALLFNHGLERDRR